MNESSGYLKIEVGKRRKAKAEIRRENGSAEN